MAKKRTGPTWWKMFKRRCKKNVETTKRTNRPPIPSLTTPIGCLTEEKRREEKQEDKKRKEGAGGKERKRNICRGVGRYFDVIMFLFAKTSAALDALSDKIVCCPRKKCVYAHCLQCVHIGHASPGGLFGIQTEILGAKGDSENAI